MNIRLLLTLLVSLSAFLAIGQPRFYAAVSDGVLLPGVSFQIQFIVEGGDKVQAITEPKMPMVEVYDSYINESQSIIPGGKGLQNVKTKVLVVTCQSSGVFRIGAATAIVDGKKLISEPIEFEIKRPGSGDEFKSSQSDDRIVRTITTIRDGESIQSLLPTNNFIKATSSKKTCYEGEAVMVSYKQYTRMQSNSSVLKRPSFTGFSVVEMVDDYEKDAEVERVNGVNYYVLNLRQVQLFPLQAGSYHLEKASIQSVITVSKAGGASNLERMMNKNAAPIKEKVLIESNDLNLTVLPLPNGSTKTGAVGQFEVKLETDQVTVAPGSLIPVRFVVMGTGNFPLIVAPEVNWPKGVDTAEPEVKENLIRGQYPLKGNKVFQYQFTAPDSGAVTLPAIAFSYFDPETKSYKTARSNELKIAVSNLVKDTATKAYVTDGVSAGTPIQYYYFAGIALVILVSIAVQWRKSKKEKQSLQMETKEQEPIQKIDYLEPAKKSLYEGDFVKTHELIQKGIWMELQERFRLNPTNQTKAGMERCLQAAGVQEEKIKQATALLALNTNVLYAGFATNEEIAMNALHTAQNLIESFPES
ncbi:MULTISPECIES: BatD family protein [unclassified Paraflavitalea]|uniref:BatD family protein n=1 Tax=unclassified Paraflavitalea TaxID=2798305 RepID=UPI003D32F69E